MKRLLKAVGILLIVCAVVLYAFAGYAQEEAKPRTVTFGAVTNGVYTQTGSGTIGGNDETAEEMGWLKAIAIMSGIAGAGAMAGSLIVKEEKEAQY